MIQLKASYYHTKMNCWRFSILAKLKESSILCEDSTLTLVNPTPDRGQGKWVRWEASFPFPFLTLSKPIWSFQFQSSCVFFQSVYFPPNPLHFPSLFMFMGPGLCAIYFHASAGEWMMRLAKKGRRKKVPFPPLFPFSWSFYSSRGHHWRLWRHNHLDDVNETGWMADRADRRKFLSFTQPTRGQFTEPWQKNTQKSTWI